MADLILCYIQQTFVDNDDGTVDIYDGNKHVFGLSAGSGSQDEGPPSKVQIQIVKTGGVITDFKMWACGGGLADNVQSEYVGQTISSGTLSMTSKGTSTFSDSQSGTSGTDQHHVTVNGPVNSSGIFTGAKTITMNHSSDVGSNDNAASLTLTQSASEFNFSGCGTGTFSDSSSGFSGSYTHNFSSESQLIDKNTSTAKGSYNIGLLAVGDGAIKVNFSDSGSAPGGSSFTHSETFSTGWNGDSAAEDASSSFISDVQNDTLGSTCSVSVATFAGDEIFDCSTAIEKTVTINQANLDSTCSNLELGHQWIDCWNETGQDSK